MIAEEIKAKVSRYFTKKRMCVHLEVGLNRRGRLRADLVALSMKGFLVVVEVKSSPRDFLTDKKWQNYLAYGHKFYFAFDEDTWNEVLHMVPRGVGIFVVSPQSSKVRVVQRAASRDMDTELETSMFIRMAFKSSDCNRYKNRRSR